MKLIKSFEKEDLSNVLDDNKELLLPLTVLIVGIFLILFIIIPQIFSLPDKLNQRNTELARLNEIKLAKDILANTNESELTAQFETVSRALPAETSFEAIFNAIAAAANTSNTQISGYKFSQSAQTFAQNGNPIPYRNLKFVLEVNGTAEQAVTFIEELYKTSPLAGVNKIDYSEGETELDIDFYYKPFTTLDQNSFLPKEFTPQQQKTYNEISAFAKPIAEPVLVTPNEEATPSSQPSEN